MIRLSSIAVILSFAFSTASAQQMLPFDFELAPTTADFVNFEGGEGSVIANPDPSGINTSDQVGQIIRFPGEIWAGSKIILSDYIDLSVVGGIRMKVRVPLPNTVVKLKLEGLAVGELDAMTTVTDEWETLVWDFTGLQSGVFNEVVFMFDFGNFGDGSQWSTFQFDDVEMFDATYGLAQIDLPINFEGDAVNYHTTSFAGNFSSLASDPVMPSNSVVEVLKTWQSLNYSGTTISTPAGLANPVPFTTEQTVITTRVFTQAAGIPVRFKAEESSNPANSVETQVLTTVGGEWETLTFDLSQQVAGTQPINLNFNYDLISIFFDFGQPGSVMGNQTFYFDDVNLEGWVADLSEVPNVRFLLYPTVLSSGQELQIIRPGGGGYAWSLYDAQGRIVHDIQNGMGNSVLLPMLQGGVYHAVVATSNEVFKQSLIIR